MLALEALTTADLAYGLICDINRVAKDGRQAEALHSLTKLAEAVTIERPVLRGVIAAQQNAAQALHLSQSPSVRVLASIGIPAPAADPANSEHSPAPDQPSPVVG